jgi:hypothetical protein
VMSRSGRQAVVLGKPGDVTHRACGASSWYDPS